MCFIFPLHLTSASALPGKHGNTKRIFFTQMLYTALLLTSRCLISSVLLTQLRLVLLYDSISLVINVVQLWAVGDHSSGERKLRKLQLHCVARTVHWCALLPSRLVTVMERSLASAGPRLWNSLPDNITAASSLSDFRRKFKIHLSAIISGYCLVVFLTTVDIEVVLGDLKNLM